MTGSLIILGIISIAVLGMVAVVIIVITQTQQKTAQAVKRNEEFLQRQQTAVWAGATIVSARSGVTGGEAGVSQWARYELSLQVTPPGGTPYLARTNWLVDVSQISLLQPGKQVSVRIDQQDPQIIYPASDGAKYIPA